MRFDGDTYDEDADKKRLATQYNRVMDAMRDRKWHSLAELSHRAGAPEASVSARLRDMRKERFGKHKVLARRQDDNRWLYRLVK